MPRYALRSAVSVGSHYRENRFLRKYFFKEKLKKHTVRSVSELKQMKQLVL